MSDATADRILGDLLAGLRLLLHEADTEPTCTRAVLLAQLRALYDQATGASA